jgi:hypothetical protein
MPLTMRETAGVSEILPHGVTPPGPAELITWRPLKPIFIKLFPPRTGLAKILRARVKIADNFRRNYFAYGKLELTCIMFLIAPVIS